MKGHLYKKLQPEGWYVAYTIDKFTRAELPLSMTDVRQIEADAKVFDNIEARIAAYSEVDFEIVTIDNGDNGIRYARLIKQEYPELEGTMELCNDIIEARANESVPAPDELQEELRRVRKDKVKHVKEGNFAIAALYREIEKLLQLKITDTAEYIIP